MRLRILSVLAALAASGAAHAQTPSLPVCYTSGTSVNCPSLLFSAGSPTIVANYVPLSALAYTTTTDGLAAVQRKSERIVSGGVAMSAAMDMIAPAEGRNNRLGGGLSTFNDEAGLALVYTRRSGDWDAGVGLATSQYENMAKATVGFSW
jgi:hypothetical protein